MSKRRMTTTGRQSWLTATWWKLRDRVARWWRRVLCWLLFEWHDWNDAGYCRRCDTYNTLDKPEQ